MKFNERYANEKTANQYIEKQGDKWVITQKGTGKVLSHHDTKEKAEASFAAMMVSKHGSGDRKEAALGCLSCGRPKGTKPGKCGKEGGQECKDAMKENARGNAANATNYADHSIGDSNTVVSHVSADESDHNTSPWLERYSNLDSDW